MSVEELEVRTVDPDGEAGRAWVTVVAHAFVDGAPDDDFLRRWRHQVHHDRQRLLGVWPAQSWVAPARPVATYASWAQSIDLGGGAMLPLHMVSDVSVAPTHRRRGLLRRMMTADLADAAAGGLPLAALTASEGSIYGRFGFGPATRLRRVEVDTTRFELRTPLPEDAGRLEVVPAYDAWPAISAVFAAHLATTRGAVDRHQFYEPMLTGAYSRRGDDRGPDPQLQVALHLAADGTPDGHAVYRFAGVEEGRRVVDVRDLVATSAEVELRLWSLLASLDLVERLRFSTMPVDSPLQWALAEPRAVRTTLAGDHLWLRVLDVPAVLAARPWSADGTVTLGVRDPLGHAAGTWEVRTEGGAATVAATDAAPDLTLDADTLGSLVLGDVAVSILAAAGRLDGAPAAVDRFGAMVDGGPAPYCATAF